MASLVADARVTECVSVAVWSRESDSRSRHVSSRQHPDVYGDGSRVLGCAGVTGRAGECWAHSGYGQDTGSACAESAVPLHNQYCTNGAMAASSSRAAVLPGGGRITRSARIGPP